jgi:phospholipase/lecithinase/hemolysin
MARVGPAKSAAIISACLASVSLAAPAAHAAYDAEYVFGDSLSDRGNIASYFFQQNFPYPPSNHDSFTNGPVAVQLLAQSLGVNADPTLWLNGFTDPHDLFGGPSFVPGTNYAVGGALAAPTAAPSINLPYQIGAYDAFSHGVADPSALYVIMIGGNDVRDAAHVGTDTSPLLLAVQTEIGAITTLASEGAKNFLIVNVPNVGLIPEFTQDGFGDPATATADSIYYNNELSTMLAGLALPASDHLHEFNLFNFNENLLANAGMYGFNNLTDPCFNDTPLSATSGTNCSLANIGDFVYWDSIHPTGKVQALWAQGMEAAVASPEPSTWAMLLLGFAATGLAGLKASRKQRAA